MVDVEDPAIPSQVAKGHLLVHTVTTSGRATKAKFNNCLLTAVAINFQQLQKQQIEMSLFSLGGIFWSWRASDLLLLAIFDQLNSIYID